MTIADGFRCLDGVAICTDSEHTAGQAKFYDKKIFEIKASNALAYLAGAGDYAYIRTAAEEIESYMNGKTVNLSDVKDLAQDTVSGIYSGHIAVARQAGDPTLTLALLLAVKVREEPRAMLYRIAETGGISNISSGVAAIGTEAGESLFRELAALLYRDSMSVYTLQHLGSYLIRRVTKFAAFCGGSPQVGCLADNGGTYLDNLASSDSGIDYLSEALYDLSLILEGSIDLAINDAAFEAILKRFSERARESREKRKQFLGQHHPIEAEGWDW